MKKQEQIKNKVQQITEDLDKGIKEVFETGKLKEYLNVLSKFHKYSSRNNLLIYRQMPNATKVAGFVSWKNDFNRHVKKGESGIAILIPTPYKIKEEMTKIDPKTQRPVLDNNGNEVKEEVEIVIPKFKVGYVFDVSQTDGEPLPSIVTGLQGDIEGYEDMIQALTKVSTVPINFESIPTGAKGYYSFQDNKIAIQVGMSEIQTIKTMIHEMAHAELHSSFHGRRKDKRTKEVEAESVAYTVSQYFGIDTSDYSFSYVGNWSSTQELDELKDSLELIQKKSSELIIKIDEVLLELSKEKVTDKDMEVTKPSLKEKLAKAKDKQLSLEKTREKAINKTKGELEQV